MPYAKIESSGCGIHKNRAKLRLDFFLSLGDPNYDKYPDSPFHSHFIYPDKDASNADIKAEIERCLNYFYAFHQHCWDKKVSFIDEWRKVPPQVGQVRCPFMKGDSKDLTANQDKVQSILSRSQEFQVGISKVPPQDLNIGDKGTIDIGEAAIDREYNTTATKIAKGNPANASGTIDTVEAWFVDPGGTGLKIGTHSMSGSDATTRDYEDIGDYTGGSKQEYTGLDIDVVSGDLIGGSVISGGGWEYDSSGYGGLWSTGTKLPLSSVACADQPGRAISCYGTGTEAGGVTHYGAATLSGIGTLAGAGRGIFIGKATLTGEGTLAAIGSFLRYAKATLSGTGTLAAIGSFLRYAKASLSGTGTLATIGRGIFAGKVTLSGIGTLTASAVVGGIKYGVVAFSGVGTLVSKGIIIAIGKASLTGMGSLSAIGRRIFTAKATLSGIGTLSAIGQVTLAGIKYGKATLAGVGTLTVNAVLTAIGKATLAGAGTLAIIGQAIKPPRFGSSIPRSIPSFSRSNIQEANRHNIQESKR